MLTTPHLQTDLVMKRIPVFWAWTDPLVRPNPWKNDKRSGIWKVRSLYRSGTLTTVARESARYKLDLVGVQEARWDNGGTVRAGDYSLFLWKKKRKSSVANKIFVHHRLVSAVEREEFVSDTILHLVLRGRRYNIIALNVHAPSEEKSGYSKDRFMRNYSRFSIIFLSTIRKFC